MRLLKGVASDRFYATLTWNRLVNQSLSSGCLSDLDLNLYRSDTSVLLRSSGSRIDNVEKVWADVSAPVVLNITHFAEGSCRESEKFGLAVSHPAFQEASGPVLQLTCNVPSQVAPGTQFSVSCTIRNTGDLAAFSTSGQLALTGVSGASSQAFGVIQPSDSATRTWTVTAPASPGSYTLSLQAESTGFGARFPNSANFGFTVASSSSCSILVSPTSLNTGSGSASFPVSVSAPAGCPWSAVSNAPWITLSGTTQGTGSGAFTLSIAANTGISVRSGTVLAGGQLITIRQDGQSSAPRTRRVLPQLAFGSSPTLGNWTTELYLHNLASTAAQVTVSFYGEDGMPMSVPKLGAMTVVNLGARGTAMIDVATPGPLLQGSIQLDLPEGVAGYGIFRQTSPGLNPQEGVVPLSSSSSSMSTIVFDETNFVTAVALCNPGGSPITVTAVARDEQGNTIGTALLPLAARQRVAFALRDRAELRSIAGRRGSVEFSSSGGTLSVLGLRFNALAFTSILPVEQ
ncbi:MAG: CARDB domain-containing protein [Bacillota bacterium]